ncbi:U32 family peptidase C-terminal domain-containing protein [candidate division KSB1 bacterium]|nr:U32 family peptidase C-terminal domain-containing protein [candidate division KSB1 bacterium]
MSHSTLRPELLMPAGNFQKLKFAIAYGADAVYAGVPVFSLRARENGFKRDAIRAAIEYTHKQGKQIYLTMNIYAHNRKVDKFMEMFHEMADMQPDGFIMTDPGLIQLSLQARPETVIHLSTQANATNWATVKFWRDLGVRRIILPRELTIEEIADTRSRVPDIELESFVHGAICISYSGRCLISNYLNLRDANQGTCTNSCRWQYQLAVEQGSLLDTENLPENGEVYKPLQENYRLKEANPHEGRYADAEYEIDEDEHGTYIMNSKDLCAIELLSELRAAGVCSFKVEGRNKSLYYAAITARAYRRAIDDLIAGRSFDSNNFKELASTSNRTFTSGFLKRNPRHTAINYDDGDSLPTTHRFAGIVIDYNPSTGRATVIVKNRLQLGDTVEWIHPHQNVTITIDAISKSNGESVTEAHGGLEYQIPSPFEPDEYTLLRQPLAMNTTIAERTL